MTARDAYELLNKQLISIYDEREAKTIARYLVEDLFNATFWSEDLITNEQINQLSDAISRLLNHEPWQYIGGMADFYGYKFYVDKSVLIPRPETEELTYAAIDIIKNRNLQSVLDVGTGSGIIPIVIGLKTALTQLYGIDISIEALSVAERNNTKHRTSAKFTFCNMLDQEEWPALPKVDMIISNPPYITENEKKYMEPNVLNYEPHQALFVDSDAMMFYRAIAQFVALYQDAGCVVLVEINENFGQEVSNVFKDAGLVNVALFKDLQAKDRIIVAQKK